MTEQVVDTADRFGFLPKGIAAKVVTGLTGILAVFVAIKAAAYVPSHAPIIENQDHWLRLMAFAALTVWTTFTIGVRRRGAAAMTTLGFAIFVELVIVPARGESMGTLVSANLGIVFAYCAMHLFALAQPAKPSK